MDDIQIRKGPEQRDHTADKSRKNEKRTETPYRLRVNESRNHCAAYSDTDSAIRESPRQNEQAYGKKNGSEVTDDQKGRVLLMGQPENPCKNR